jgi:hypothetical protein
MKGTLSRCVVVTLGLLLLAGCGGGGNGGGGGGGGDTQGGIIYVGNTNPAVITATNASRLVANIVGSGDASGVIAGPAVATASISQGARDSSSQSGLVHRLNTYQHETLTRVRGRPSGSRVSAAAILVDDTVPCDDGGSIRYSGTLNDNGTGTLTVTYSDCRSGDDTLNGVATLRIDAFDLTFPVSTDSTFSFSILTLTSPTTNESVSGSLRDQVDIATNAETLTVNMVTRDNISGEMTKAENLIVVDVYNSVLSPSSYTETIGGRIYDSVHGFVDVATIEPLVFSTLPQLFPSPGQFVLAGAGNRSIGVTAISATQVMFELDLDGDTNYELWTTILWTEVSATTVVDFVRPTAPVVSVSVNIDRSVTISWSPSSDSKGIREYRIQRDAMPIGRTTDTSFTDRSVEPGSIVDYFVRAVDNSGNLSDLLPPQSVSIPSGGTAVFDPPISGTLPFTPNTHGVGIGVADVNGDGNRDLVVSGGDTNRIATALGPVTAGVAFTTSPIDFATMSNDANLPFFLLANITGSDLPEALGAGRTLVWNVANNTWEDSAGSNQSFQFEARAYIDINDDGILDIVNVTPSSSFPPTLSGTLGTGNGSYDVSSRRELAGIKNFVWGSIGQIVVTDIDRDGLADLVVWDSASIRVIRQTQRRSFAVTTSLPAIDHRGFRAALHIADVTGDGYPEIIYAHYSDSINDLRVYVNDGSGNYGSTAISSNVSEPWNFAAGDINGDGIKDLVVNNRLSNALGLYISRGDGTFTLSSSITNIAGFLPFLTLADIDLDGDIDIVTAGAFGNTDAKVYLNR